MTKQDISNLRFPDNSFDLIICQHVLEHVANDRKAIKELYRVLSPNGSLYITVPLKQGPTLEDKNIKSPILRKQTFGHEDHLRIYGEDLIDLLQEFNFSTKTENYNPHQGQGHSISIYDSIKNKREVVLICSKRH